MLVINAGSTRYRLFAIGASIPQTLTNNPSECPIWDTIELQSHLDRTLAHSRGVLEGLTVTDLEAQRLGTRDGRIYSVAWALNHALEHTGLHLGHMQIGRHLWEQRSR